MWKPPNIAGHLLPKSVVGCLFPACFPLGIGACEGHADADEEENGQNGLPRQIFEDASQLCSPLRYWDEHTNITSR